MTAVLPSVPVRCIEVDAPSRLYLTGEAMVPTHNSLLASGFGHYFHVADGEAEPEVYVAAVARGQAGIALGQRDGGAVVGRYSPEDAPRH